MTKWIEVRYKCACMQDEVAFQVRARRPDEDIFDFMHHFQLALGIDHHTRSPSCRASSVEYAKMPMHDNVIGGPERSGTA